MDLSVHEDGIWISFVPHRPLRPPIGYNLKTKQNRHGLMPWPQSGGPQCAVDGSGRKGIVGSRDLARESSYYEQRRVSNGLDPLDTMKKHAVERFVHGKTTMFHPQCLHPACRFTPPPSPKTPGI
jgi:hypothetical protein